MREVRAACSGSVYRTVVYFLRAFGSVCPCYGEGVVSVIFDGKDAVLFCTDVKCYVGAVVADVVGFDVGTGIVMNP